MRWFLLPFYKGMEKFFFSFFRVKKEFRFMGLKNYILYFIFQRGFRINSSVPWPVHLSSVVTVSKNIKFKNEITPVGYSPGSYIQALNGIEIGSNVIHAVGLTIVSSNHDVCDFVKHVSSKPVIIGDNCWLAANVTILPEVVLGDHTIVAAGSVVTKSFLEGNCIIAGVPAKKIKAIPAYNGKHYFIDSDDN